MCVHRSILSLSLIALMNVSAQQNISSSDREAFQRIVEEWKSGYNAGDAQKVAGLYLADAYYLTQHFITGIVHGRPAIQAYVQRGIDARYQIDSIRILYMDRSEKSGYVITRYHSTNSGQQAFGVNLAVLKKVGERWFIAAHEATVPDPATAIQQLSINEK